MSFELNEKIVGIWYSQVEPDIDWMAQVTEEENTIDIEYRFRYYNDDKVFNSTDEKNWYKASIKKGEGVKIDTIKTMREMIKGMKTLASDPGESFELLNNTGNFDDFMQEFMLLPFVHTQIVDAETGEEVKPN